MKSAAECIAIGVTILLVCFGCAHCERTRVETDIMLRQQDRAEAVEKPK